MTNDRLKITLVVLQLVIAGVAIDIRMKINNHEERLDLLEQFRAKGDRWTMSEQRIHEEKMERKFDAIDSKLANILVMLAEKADEDKGAGVVRQRLKDLESRAHIHQDWTNE